MVVFQVEDRDAPRILITEPLAEVGMDLLRRELPEALVEQRDITSQLVIRGISAAPQVIAVADHASPRHHLR